MITETSRLILREMDKNDFQALYDIFSDPETMRYYPSPFDEAKVMDWISRNSERYRIFGFGLWAVTLKNTNEVIGDCGLTMQMINGSIKPEIGYHIRKDLQRQGYAKEAAGKCRDWIFTKTPFNTLYSYMNKDNIASAATAMSIGMKKVDEYINSEGILTSVYAITRKEWELLNIK